MLLFRYIWKYSKASNNDYYFLSWFKCMTIFLYSIIFTIFLNTFTIVSCIIQWSVLYFMLILFICSRSFFYIMIVIYFFPYVFMFTSCAIPLAAVNSKLKLILMWFSRKNFVRRIYKIWLLILRILIGRILILLPPYKFMFSLFS